MSTHSKEKPRHVVSHVIVLCNTLPAPVSIRLNPNNSVFPNRRGYTWKSTARILKQVINRLPPRKSVIKVSFARDKCGFVVIFWLLFLSSAEENDEGEEVSCDSPNGASGRMF